MTRSGCGARRLRWTLLTMAGAGMLLAGPAWAGKTRPGSPGVKATSQTKLAPLPPTRGAPAGSNVQVSATAGRRAPVIYTSLPPDGPPVKITYTKLPSSTVRDRVKISSRVPRSFRKKYEEINDNMSDSLTRQMRQVRRLPESQAPFRAESPADAKQYAREANRRRANRRAELMAGSDVGSAEVGYIQGGDTPAAVRQERVYASISFLLNAPPPAPPVSAPAPAGEAIPVVAPKIKVRLAPSGTFPERGRIPALSRAPGLPGGAPAASTGGSQASALGYDTVPTKFTAALQRKILVMQTKRQIRETEHWLERAENQVEVDTTAARRADARASLYSDKAAQLSAAGHTDVAAYARMQSRQNTEIAALYRQRRDWHHTAVQELKRRRDDLAEQNATR